MPGFTFVASISAIVYARAIAGPGRGRRLLQPRSGRRRGAHHAPDQGHHRRPHARRAGAARRAEGHRRPARHRAHRGLCPGLRCDVPGPGRRRHRHHRRLQLQRVQDHHLRRRRHDRHRRRGRCTRRLFAIHDQGHAPEPPRVEIRRAAVPGHELPDDRAVGRRAAGAGPQARPDPRPPPGEQGHRQVGDRRTCRGSGSGPSSTRKATSRPTSSSTLPDRRRSPQAVADELGSITLAASGWHVYANMEHLLERRTVSGQGLPVRLRVLRRARGRTIGPGCCPAPTPCSHDR